ncbi:MAG: hypothetical protein RIS29_1384 [Bacteroidota bacterium]|jgi:hypothetical protein
MLSFEKAGLMEFDEILMFLSIGDDRYDHRLCWF